MPRVYLVVQPKFNFSLKELFNYLISMLILTISLTIVMSGGFYIFFQIFNGTYSLFTFFNFLFISFLIASTGIILHELGHKLTANFLGIYAVYELSIWGSIIAIISSFFLVLIAVPGGVSINSLGRPPSNRNISRVALAGPLINIFIGIIFLFLFYFMYFFYNIISMTFWYVMYFNIYIGAFNILIPFLPFDGGYVFRYERKLWILLAIISIILLIFSNLSFISLF